MRSTLLTMIAVAAMGIAACSKPGADSLRESFVQQLSANHFVKSVQRDGDDVRFQGPGADGDAPAAWRVHIDSTSIETNTDTKHPYKGIIKSSWYANDRLVTPRGQDSNLPIELTSNGLAQECWALWDPASRQWSWE